MLKIEQEKEEIRNKEIRNLPLEEFPIEIRETVRKMRNLECQRKNEFLDEGKSRNRFASETLDIFVHSKSRDDENQQINSIDLQIEREIEAAINGESLNSAKSSHKSSGIIIELEEEKVEGNINSPKDGEDFGLTEKRAEKAEDSIEKVEDSRIVLNIDLPNEKEKDKDKEKEEEDMGIVIEDKKEKEITSDKKSKRKSKRRNKVKSKRTHQETFPITTILNNMNKKTNQREGEQQQQEQQEQEQEQEQEEEEEQNQDTKHDVLTFN
jgi:hypothetical protein